MDDLKKPIAELAAEQADLEALLRRLPEETWAIPTPAAGWDVRDQVSHLADTEEIAHDTATGGPRQLNQEALSFTSPEAFTESGCVKGRAMRPAEVLTWWASGAVRTRAALEQKDPAERIPWGLGMSARAFVAARLMEHWAHGLDIRAAAGVEPNITPRLRNVVWLITRAFPYAFRVAKREPPEGTLRIELDFNGDRWDYGPDDADNLISGQAGEFCMVGVQRLKLGDAKTLRGDGPLAAASLEVARAFL